MWWLFNKKGKIRVNKMIIIKICLLNDIISIGDYRFGLYDYFFVNKIFIKELKGDYFFYFFDSC